MQLLVRRSWSNSRLSTQHDASWTGQTPAGRQDRAQWSRAVSGFHRHSVQRWRPPRVKLRVVGIEVGCQAETGSKLTQVGGVEQEQQRSKYGALRDATAKRADGRKDPIEEDRLSAIAEV